MVPSSGDRQTSSFVHRLLGIDDQVDENLMQLMSVTDDIG